MHIYNTRLNLNKTACIYACAKIWTFKTLQMFEIALIFNNGFEIEYINRSCFISSMIDIVLDKHERNIFKKTLIRFSIKYKTQILFFTFYINICRIYTRTFFNSNFLWLNNRQLQFRFILMIFIVNFAQMKKLIFLKTIISIKLKDLYSFCFIY